MSSADQFDRESCPSLPAEYSAVANSTSMFFCRCWAVWAPDSSQFPTHLLVDKHAIVRAKQLGDEQLEELLLHATCTEPQVHRKGLQLHQGWGTCNDCSLLCIPLPLSRNPYSHTGITQREYTHWPALPGQPSFNLCQLHAGRSKQKPHQLLCGARCQPPALHEPSATNAHLHQCHPPQ